MGDQTEFRQGSALDMPFPDQSFDVAWTEHVQMNIEDKEGFYSEMVRVIKPGGKLVFHDIFRGSVGELHFPVPWAGDPSISFLVTPQEIQELLASLGFRIQYWEDKTVASLEFFSQVVSRFPVPRASAHRNTPAHGRRLLVQIQEPKKQPEREPGIRNSGSGREGGQLTK